MSPNVKIGCWSRGVGKPGFPVPPPAGGPGPQAGVWGNRISPRPRPREGLGGQSPPRRTLLSPCGCGPEARAPGPRPTGGSGRAAPSQEQPFFIPSVCGGAAWTANVNIRPRRGVWGNRVSPRPRPAGGWGNRVSPCPHPREGLGGLRPPRNKLIFIAALCGGAAWTAEVNIPPCGRGWEGAARAQGYGEPRFPHTPTQYAVASLVPFGYNWQRPVSSGGTLAFSDVAYANQCRS